MLTPDFRKAMATEFRRLVSEADRLGGIRKGEKLNYRHMLGVDVVVPSDYGLLLNALHEVIDAWERGEGVPC